MNLSDLEIGQIVRIIYNGYYVPKYLSGYTAKIIKINKKLIEVEIISKHSKIPNYKISIDNIIKN